MRPHFETDHLELQVGVLVLLVLWEEYAFSPLSVTCGFGELRSLRGFNSTLPKKGRGEGLARGGLKSCRYGMSTVRESLQIASILFSQKYFT